MSRRGGWIAFAATILLAELAQGRANPRDYVPSALTIISGRSPYPDGCNGSGSLATSAEGEPTLAIDRTNPANIVAAWKQDTQPSDSTADGVAVSRDGGVTWQR